MSRVVVAEDQGRGLAEVGLVVFFISRITLFPLGYQSPTWSVLEGQGLRRQSSQAATMVRALLSVLKMRLVVAEAAHGKRTVIQSATDVTADQEVVEDHQLGMLELGEPEPRVKGAMEGTPVPTHSAHRVVAVPEARGLTAVSTEYPLMVAPGY